MLIEYFLWNPFSFNIQFVFLNSFSTKGNYRDAAACYEKVIQTDRDNISSHEVSIIARTCYNLCVLAGFTSLHDKTRRVRLCSNARQGSASQQVSHRQKVYVVKKLSLLVRPVWMKRLNSYRVEAAWNLGQWDILQEHLSMVVSSTY